MSGWSSDVCSSDLEPAVEGHEPAEMCALEEPAEAVARERADQPKAAPDHHPAGDPFRFGVRQHVSPRIGRFGSLGSWVSMWVKTVVSSSSRAMSRSRRYERSWHCWTAQSPRSEERRVGK